MSWLLVVGGQEQGSSYASGIKEAARLRVQQIISAINHSVASSWFSSLRVYNDARTDILKGGEKNNGPKLKVAR
jgi:hypothetical protein